METLKIKHDKSKDGYAIINKSDFDPKVHELFDSAPKREKAAVAEAPAKKAAAKKAPAKKVSK